MKHSSTLFFYAYAAVTVSTPVIVEPGRRRSGSTVKPGGFRFAVPGRQASAMSEPPRVTRLLPDAVHQAISRPGTAVVRLETTHDRKGALDGAWWPRSRDIAGELPDLVSALSEYLGPITRVGLDTDAWTNCRRG